MLLNGRAESVDNYEPAVLIRFMLSGKAAAAAEAEATLAYQKGKKKSAVCLPFIFRACFILT